MADRWEAPAKLNLSLQVRPPDRSGYHPVRSLVQTIEWLDLLDVEAADEDELRVEGLELAADDDNLIWKAVRSLVDAAARPRLSFVLHKTIAVAAGLGGGSSDAAAALRATAAVHRITDSVVTTVAPAIGADVPFFLVGGTAWMEGYGERIAATPSLEGFAVAVVVPPFELATPAVYRAWDRLEFPEGPAITERHLPPALRGEGSLGNDLFPAACDLAPELADWVSDLADHWGRPVLMSGSGPSLFAFFSDEEESASAAAEVAERHRAAVGVGLRDRGVSIER